MSKFDNINEIKENFEENLKQSNGYFSRAKKAFANFDEFMQNPKIALGLWAAVVTASGTLGYEIYQDNQKMSLNNQNVSLNVYDTKRFTTSENRVEEMTNSFLNIHTDLSKIKNQQYDEKTLNFNKATHGFMKAYSENDGHVFKNPFWQNNIVTVYNRPNKKSKYHPESLPNTTIDTSNHVIEMDYIEIKKIGEKMQVPETAQYLVDSYVFYHEAAHASYSQSIPYSGMTTNAIDNELKSDISSLMLIGHNNKEDFDYLIDKVIKYRIEGVSPRGDMEGYSHNTGYGLIELKKAVQKNPMILDMQPENISQFSDMFVKELKSINLTTHHENSLKDMTYPTPKEIEHDIYYNNKNSMYSSIIYHQIYEGFSNNYYNRAKLLPLSDAYATSDDIEKASVSISNRLKTNLRYDSLTSMVIENSKNPDEVVKKLKAMVDEKPALKNDFITAIAKGNLIYIDELKVNIEPVKQVEESVRIDRLKLLEQQNENNLKRKVNLQKPNMNNNNS